MEGESSGFTDKAVSQNVRLLGCICKTCKNCDNDGGWVCRAFTDKAVSQNVRLLGCICKTCKNCDDDGGWVCRAFTSDLVFMHARHSNLGLARTVYKHCIWPYIWRFSCQKYRIYTVYIWFWPTILKSDGCTGEIRRMHSNQTDALKSDALNSDALKSDALKSSAALEKNGTQMV